MSTYKRTFLLIICAIFAMIFAACDNKKNDANYNTIDIMSKLLCSLDIKDYSSITKLDANCQKQLLNFYEFNDTAIATISDITILKANGVSADEFIIIKTSDTKTISDCIKRYIDKRLGDFTGYAPLEADKLSHASLVTASGYVALFVCDNSPIYEDSFNDCMKNSFSLSKEALNTRDYILNVENSSNHTDKPNTNNTNIDVSPDTEEVTVPETGTDDSQKEPSTSNEDRATNTDSPAEGLVKEIPGVIEPYNTEHILNAYKTGNSSSLTDEKDIIVLDECKKILASEIKADMTDFEKELAIHDYIVKHTEYDKNALIYSDWYTEYADQPYGTLINKTAICLGYTSTFKLLLDMLDIECIIVKGTAYDYNANHAWNLVKLDNEWYAVDVTWDDPIKNNRLVHKYFNVNDDYLLKKHHHWNQTEYPAATGTRYSYK